jgi:SAM-dependent methyltransferase
VSQIFGQVYAPAYDLLCRDKDYDAEVDLLQQLFGKYADRQVRSILDLGCGTGNHGFRLADRGYRVVGVDRSAEMLAEAYRKLEKCHADVRFHQADIRDGNLGQTFDAVLMMFAVLGYQIEDADVLRALQTARRHLQSNGLLFFDIWYGPAVLAQGPEERVRTIEQAGKTWMRTSSGRLETQRNLCHVEFQLRRMSGDRVLEETKESHTVRYFFAKEIDSFLDSSGFRCRRLGAFPEFDRDPDHTTWNVMVVGSAD